MQCALVVARVTEGAEEGLEVEVWSPPTVPVGELGEGTPIVLVNYPATETDAERIARRYPPPSPASGPDDETEALLRSLGM